MTQSRTEIDWERRKQEREAARRFRLLAEALGSDDFDAAERTALARQEYDRDTWRILHPR